MLTGRRSRRSIGVADHVAWTGLEAVLIPYPLVAAKISDTGKPKFNITSDATSPAPSPRPAAAPRPLRRSRAAARRTRARPRPATGDRSARQAVSGPAP